MNLSIIFSYEVVIKLDLNYKQGWNNKGLMLNNLGKY